VLIDAKTSSIKRGSRAIMVKESFRFFARRDIIQLLKDG